MIPFRVLGVLATLQLALLTSAHAQQARPVVDDENPIIVTAPSATQRQRVSAYVSAMTMPGRRAALPRWGRTLCPGTVGISETHAQALIDRIARVALDLGIEIGEPGCRANLVVYFTHDPAQTATVYLQQRRLISEQSGPDAAMRDFIESSRAVRWWHVSSTLSDGVEIDREDRSGSNARRDGESTAQLDTGTDSVSDETMTSPHGTRVRNASRLRSNVEENLFRVLIIVDADQVATLRYGTLVDYITMISLAQINPDAPIAHIPTVLNLFADAAGSNPTGLTEWDLAYLEGLYNSPENARDSRQQENDILRSMMRPPE